LAALLLEDDDLVGALLLQDLGGHAGAGHGAARLGVALAGKHQNVAKLDDIAGLARDFLNLDNVVRRNAILLAARANDREHVFLIRLLRLELPATRRAGRASKGAISGAI
jgi:hypothetical protein